MKVAIVHYWLVTWRGGEKVLAELMRLYPTADLYCHVVDPDLVEQYFPERNVTTTWVNRLPGARRWYKAYMPVMAFASEQIDLRGYDLIISSESGPAKNLITDPDSTHICYCHSPMRYIWDMTHVYIGPLNPLLRFALAPLIHYLRTVDQLSANRVDHFIANSSFIQKRITKAYRREADVIHPPVDVDAFLPAASSEDYYLVLGQLTCYKRVDVVVEAFNRSGKRVLIIGEGEEYEKLCANAQPNVSFLGKVEFNRLKTHLQHARALVFPGVEDFGIVPLEALASGTPVIAYARGGALDYLQDGETGVLFNEQTAESLNAAIDRFEKRQADFVPERLAAVASEFSSTAFRARWLKMINQVSGESTPLVSVERRA